MSISKTIFHTLFIGIILNSFLAISQTNGDFQELKDPTSDTLSDWTSVSEDLHASFVTKDKRFAKHRPPEIKTKKTIHIKGWKGEKLSTQLLLWTRKSALGVEVIIPDLKKEGSYKKIEAQSFFERYVMTDEFAGGCGYRDPEDFAARLSPDMLDDLNSYNIEGKSVRPVWVSVNIPREIDQGIYKTTIRIEGKESSAQNLDLQVEVLDHTLPKPKDWKYHLDLWQNPSAVARVNDVDLWSKEHFKLLKPLMKRLADAGQKVITTTLNKDPWNVQTYDPYDDMITWTKNENGNWEYDYTIFDKWVKFMMELGIDKMINAYSILPWNDEIHYKDESGVFVDVKAKPGTDKFTEYWKPFLKDFSNHLRKKGWLDITNIALDERPPKQMEIVFKLLKNVAPDLGVSYADNHKTYQKFPGSKDVSIAADHPFSKKDLKKRQKNKLNTTFYIYCGNEFINTFTFSDPAESTYSAWYALANGFDGMLRWSYNSWTKTPLRDSRFRSWPAGDTYIVYPGNRSSIRFERLVEGIQDYEKATVILKELREHGEEDKLNKLIEAINKLEKSKRTQDWNENLNLAKQVLNSY